jgi:hypothetical protein
MTGKAKTLVGAVDVAEDVAEAIATETPATEMMVPAVIVTTVIVAAVIATTVIATTVIVAEVIVTAVVATRAAAMVVIHEAVEVVAAEDQGVERTPIRRTKLVNRDEPPFPLGWKQSIFLSKTISRTTKRPRLVAADRVVETAEDVVRI